MGARERVARVEGHRDEERPAAWAGYPANDVFPRGELTLACSLALALRLAYLVGVAQGPLFLHPVVQGSPHHPYAWFLAGLSGLTGSDPLLLRVVQALLDCVSVFLLGATAHEIWGRRAAVFTAEVAALYGPLIYFASDLSPGTFSFFLVAASMYACARLSRLGSRAGLLAGALALTAATIVAIQGGAGAGLGPGGGSPMEAASRALLAWNRREVPCGLMDQAFFAPWHSPIFRLPWLLAFAAVAPVALVAAWKERRRAPLLVGYLACVTIALAATEVCDRTRLTLMAAALPLAGRGVDEFLHAFDRAAARAHAWLLTTLGGVARAHGGTVVALVLCFAVVTVPFPRTQRPRAGAGWLVVARAYIAAENPREAQRAFDQAEQSGLRTSEFYTEWGRLEYEKRLGILAEQHLVTAVQLDPSNPEAHECLGDVYRAQENYEPAGQEYALAAGLVPARAAELYTRAGEAYLDGKATGRAREMFRKALDKSPGYEAAAAGLERILHPQETPEPAPMFAPLSPSSGR